MVAFGATFGHISECLLRVDAVSLSKRNEILCLYVTLSEITNPYFSYFSKKVPGVSCDTSDIFGMGQV